MGMGIRVWMFGWGLVLEVVELDFEFEPVGLIL